MPVRNPGVGQHPRRIEFQYFALAKELVYTIDVQIGFPGSESPFASGARIHFKELGLAFVAIPPELELPGIGESLKYPLCRRVDIYFADDRILIGSNHCLCHSWLLD